MGNFDFKTFDNFGDFGVNLDPCLHDYAILPAVYALVDSFQNYGSDTCRYRPLPSTHIVYS